MKKITKTSTIFFLGPSVVMYSLLVIIPVIFTSYYSFTDWSGIGPQTFIGFQNFIEMFREPDFLTTFKNTLIVTVISIAFQIPIGLILSYLLYRGIRGFKYFRAIYFLPVVIAPMAIGLMFTLFLNNETGVLNDLLGMIGLGRFQTAWLSNPDVVLYSVISPQVWQYIGLYVIIFLAAMQTIPEEIIESARIDGASTVIIFYRIVCPMISDVIKIAIILCFTGSLKSFDYPWIMTSGGPGVQSAYLGVYMFRAAFINFSFGKGSATNLIILITALVFTMVFQKVTSGDKKVRK